MRLGWAPSRAAGGLAPPITASGRLALSLIAIGASACGTSGTSTRVGLEPSTETSSIAIQHRAIALRIIDAARTSSGAYRRLEVLTDRIGHRLSGSEALDRAIRWAESEMKTDGLDRVHLEPVMVPRWVRGEERAEIVRPIARKLHLLGLGGSVGTPKGGISAPIVVVRTYDELDKLGERVRGKIVVFDNPMPAYGPEGAHYGETVVFRSSGAARASKLGALAVLVRSVTARSLRSPHTGATRYDPKIAPIPAAALSTEDSALLARLARSSDDVELHLELGAKMMPDVESANVVGEISGTTKPDEAVILGAHVDSWDVGQGAHDDGSGCVTMLEALALLKRLALQPARTIRVVLFTNEENGLRGAAEYAKAHAKEKLVAAIEMDSGGFRPIGFTVETKGAIGRVQKIARLLEPIGASRVVEGHSGADIGALKDLGTTLLGLDVEGSRYFDYHHSEADTLDKIDGEDLKLDVAAAAVMAWVLANE